MAEAIEDSDILHVSQLLDGFDKEHPGTAFALFHRGNLARLEGREDDAIKLFREAIERAPKSAPVWNNLGVLLAMRGERDQAVAAFHKTLEAMPQDRTALEGLTQLRALVKLLRDPKDQNSAMYVDLPTFEKMAGGQIQQIGNDPDQLLNYGEQLLRDGLAPEVGFQALQRAHALRPDHRHTVFAITAAHRLRKETDQARAVITAYIADASGGRGSLFSPRAGLQRGGRYRGRAGVAGAAAGARSECARAAGHPFWPGEERA